MGPPLPRLLLLIAAAAVALALLADRWAYAHIIYPDVYEHDWGRMLRTMGFLPFWLAAGVAMLLCDRPQPAWPRRGLLLMIAATLGGASAELLKLLVRRERPSADSATYIFRGWSDHPFSTRGLGMPSSHGVVAFAAAAMLARLLPRARVVWYALAVGCALTRVLSRAHFLSDVVVAALCGYAVAALLWRVSQPPPASELQRG